jgi:hypothetical protein
MRVFPALKLWLPNDVIALRLGNLHQMRLAYVTIRVGTGIRDWKQTRISSSFVKSHPGLLSMLQSAMHEMQNLVTAISKSSKFEYADRLLAAANAVRLGLIDILLRIAYRIQYVIYDCPGKSK